MNLLTTTWAGYASLIAFILAYTLVILEERLHLRKSKPVLLTGCLMWVFIALYEAMAGGRTR